MEPTRGNRVAFWTLLLGLGLAGSATSVFAGEGPDDTSAAPPPKADEAPLPDDAVVAVVRANELNVRVGPRRDNNPVTQLDEGSVVLVVERVGEWAGVRVPAGFAVALSGKHVEPVGADAVRVKASTLNLRVSPPDAEGPMPGAFRDQVHAGDLLPLVRKEGDWYWVLAPEPVRAYVFAKYLEVLGPPAEHADLLAKARAERTDLVQSMVDSRKRLRVMKASMAVRGAIGTAQQALERARVQGGHDRLVVMHIVDGLDKVLADHPDADPRAATLARLLREDLDAELALREARKEAELARLRGETPEPEAPLTPTKDEVQVRGLIRWEAAPRWREGGAFLLWVEGKPAYVLRLTTGTPRPLPDLKKSCDGKPRTVRGRQPGDRVFGLPAIDVVTIGR
ncbi:MAG: hypothetical protein QNJ98_03735 [Planctomycetota bacterium]|nr:hypothetical protein [Planctomycetota bacterium]